MDDSDGMGCERSFTPFKTHLAALQLIIKHFIKVRDYSLITPDTRRMPWDLSILTFGDLASAAAVPAAAYGDADRPFTATSDV